MATAVGRHGGTRGCIEKRARIGGEDSQVEGGSLGLSPDDRVASPLFKDLVVP